jgi:uncharacterized protein YggE
MAPLQVNVTGKGCIYRPADRAILVLQASCSKQPNAKEASTIITTTTNQIREIITPFCPDNNTIEARKNAAIAHYSMSTLQTSNHPQARRSANDTTTSGPTEYDTLYSAKAEFHIKFSDFALLGKLATQFSTMENVNIGRIDWKLTEENELSIHSETRQKAAKDFRQRAYDYAVAIGGVPESELETRVKPSWLKESQYYTQSTRPHLHTSKTMMGHGMNVANNEFAFQPEDVGLEVTIEGRFDVID